MLYSHRLINAILIGWFHSAHAATLRHSDGHALVGQHNENFIHHRILQDTQVGTFLIKDIEYEDRRALIGGGQLQQNDRPNHTSNIQLPDGTIYEVKNAQAGWASSLKSGKYSVQIPAGAVVSSDGTIDMKGKKLNPTAIFGNRSNGGGGGGLFDRSLLEEDDATERTPEQQRNLDALQSSRLLQSGARTVLVVRVILTDGAYNYADQTGLSNDVFGNGVDAVNLKSQYAACSANQLTFSKTPNRSMSSNPNDGTTAINNGVVDIKVALAKSAGDNSVRNAVTTKINTVFGVTSPNQLANHVMYCLPSGTMGGIAYAYINSWNSVYSNEWCNYLSAQMHEIGHNLGYAHSNEGATSYADQTGMMGYSYSQDDGPVMCFNPAKSWQTQWYASKSTVVDPSAGNCFEGKVYGIADYSNVASSVVLVKIDDASATDYFVTFNRQSGINSGTQEGGNQVTVIQAGGEGTSHAESSLLAKLGAGGIWSGSIDGKTMKVTVLSITTSASPAYATVRISENGNSCITTDPIVTNAPTRLPTRSPSRLPTRSPTRLPTRSPTRLPTRPPTRLPTPTKLPTRSPTRLPTPTKLPTRSPTRLPTRSPTTLPTLPTSSPTRLPTSSPTSSPMTSSSPTTSETGTPSSPSPTTSIAPTHSAAPAISEFPTYSPSQST